MDLIFGATSKVAREYVSHLVREEVDSYLVSRSGNQNVFPKSKKIRGHITQDLASCEWGSLEDFLRNGDFSRVIYFATVNIGSHGSLNEAFEINYNAVSRIVSLFPREIPFTYISTDMVFTENEFCDENRVPSAPFGDYGVLKRKGEEAALGHDKGLVVRFGNVIGTRKDFLAGVAGKLNRGEKVPVWTNVYNIFSGVEDIFLVLDSLRSYKGNQKIFHAVSRGEPLSRYELARDFVYFCIGSGILPKYSLDRVKPIKANLKDGRPSFLGLTNEITERELGIMSRDLFISIEKSVSRGYPYLV